MILDINEMVGHKKCSCYNFMAYKNERLCCFFASIILALSSAGNSFHCLVSLFLLFYFYDFISYFCCCLAHTYVNNKENTRKCNKFLVDYKNSCLCQWVCVSQSNRQRALQCPKHDDAQLKTRASCGVCVFACVCAQQRLTNFL